MKLVTLALALALCVASTAEAAAPLKVGATLHPYYSWTSNLAKGLPIEVRSILPSNIDAGDYQPRPEDIKKLADLDAIVINGVGHDDFIQAMIAASGNKKIVIINPNEGVPLIRAKNGGTINSHTFISFTNAIQQTYGIQKALAALRPDLKVGLENNAAEYAKRLRGLKATAAAELVHAKINAVVTVHDGYSYLLQELGVDIALVVEPAHGLVPSAGELEKLVAEIKRQKLKVVLSEESFPKPLLKVLEDAGARVYIISHIASGEYTPDKFEKEMESNARTLVQALVKDG